MSKASLSLIVSVVLGIALAASCKLPPGAFAAPVQCTGGAELINNTCYCANGMQWNGLTCQGTPDGTGCQGNAYLFGPVGAQSCHCMLGNTLDSSGTCVALQCTGGAVPGDTQCVCPNNGTWDGAQCQAAAAAPQCSGGAVPNGDQCACPDGTTWDGTNCVAAAQPDVAAPPQCPDGSSWDGTQCVAAQVAPAPRRTCRTVMLEKNYEPGLLQNCNGVNERCAVTLLDKNYEPGLLQLCKGVDGACAEELLNKNYEPGQLGNCKRH
jgi:hypothetical protein